jgi:protein-tyrosine-phosphatase
VPPEVADYLMQKRFDVGAHRRRTLTQPIIDAAHLVVAMSLDHRDFIRARFGRRRMDALLGERLNPHPEHTVKRA